MNQEHKSTYACDCCGACCQGALLVEAYELNVIREPRLLHADIGGWKRTIDDLADETRCILLAANRPCQSWGLTIAAASILPVPMSVWGCRLGDEQCQQVRGKLGLPPLEPVQGSESPAPWGLRQWRRNRVGGGLTAPVLPHHRT